MVKMFWLSGTADFWYAHFSFVVQQIKHKFKIQKVDKMEEKGQRNSYLS
jgi:hypothetical protein